MSELNCRERYLATMHFMPGVRPPQWEFGYWFGTLERWYQEGLRRTPFSPAPGYPPGNVVLAEFIPFPSVAPDVRGRDLDVHRHVGSDPGAVRIPLNCLFCPPCATTVLEEDETTRLIINGMGQKLREIKSADSPPQLISGPVEDWASWEKIKEERFNANNITARLPDRWAAATAPTYHGRDYPLGVLMYGFFSVPRELLCVDRQLMMYYTDPALMHDISARVAELWLAILEEVLSYTDLDFVYFFEDMSFKNGPLISPAMFREFMTPYYQKVTGFLKGKGIDVLCVDTDGDCRLLIPEFIAAGITGLYPFEVQAGMDVWEVRKQYPRLQIVGGMDKTKLARGGEAIEFELAKAAAMLTRGGYIPTCDHHVHPEISWQNYCRYREGLQRRMENFD